MTKLVWDQVGERIFETGLDRGVFYPFSGSDGVAWNGLTSINENVDTIVTPVHFDGVKFDDIVVIGDFSATLTAFTYPDEFLEVEGIVEDQRGVFLTNQPQSLFHLCYRTKIGDDVEGINQGYKIHILYNLTAVPQQRNRQTLSLEIDPMEFQWKLTSIPEEVEGYRATAHIIFDSRDMDEWLLQDLEDIIYGDEDSPPRLPSMDGLITFIRKWNRLIIVDNGDGTWDAISSRDDGTIVMLDSTTFQITTENVVWLEPDTYDISSSDKNEEDV